MVRLVTGIEDIFSSKMSINALWTATGPTQWVPVPATLSLEQSSTVTTHLHLVPRLRMLGTISSVTFCLLAWAGKNFILPGLLDH